LHVKKNKFNTNKRGVPKSAEPVAIATFTTIVNPTLILQCLLLGCGRRFLWWNGSFHWSPEPNGWKRFHTTGA